jgi:N-acetylglucosaminyl-diphospho-decaprenol L-rhamnosyltransferase
LRGRVGRVGRVGDAVARVSAARALLGHRRELARLAADLDPDVIALWGMRSAIAWGLGGVWRRPRGTGGVGDTGGTRGIGGIGGARRIGGARSIGGAPGTRIVIAHHDMLPRGSGIARLVRSAAARADAVVVNSHAVAHDLDPTGSLGSRLSVVYPGVDPAASSWPDGPPVVVVVGALVGWKRVDLALEAIALARRSVPSLALRVVGGPLTLDGTGTGTGTGTGPGSGTGTGTGPCPGPGSGDDDRTLRRLRARAAEPDLSGAVHFTGAIADVADELARATCLLHCAEREPFGLVVAEALAAGRPVVVPAAGGPAEIADTDCGVLYPPGDVVAAAAGVVSLVRQPALARALGEAGRRRVAERFGRPRMRAEFAAALTPAGDGVSHKLAYRSGNWPNISFAQSPAADPAPACAQAPAADPAPACAQAPAADPAPAGAQAPGVTASAPLALVTVSFNSAAVLGALLDSAARHLPGVRVIVVDCASSDGSVRIARQHPSAVSVPAGGNLGFGAGSNLGLTHVSEAVTVFVNPDVELVDDSLLSLAAALAADGRDRLLAPLVLSATGARQDTVHPAPGSAADLARLVLPPGRAVGPLGTAIAPWRSRRPRPVGWAVGCALAGRTMTLQALGPFSDSIFMYGEDLELGLRAARSGVPTWFWPHARVIHHGAHSTGAAYGGEPFEVLARARHGAISMALGEATARRDDGRQTALFASRAVLKRALRRDHRRELAQLAAVRGL